VVRELDLRDAVSGLLSMAPSSSTRLKNLTRRRMCRQSPHRFGASQCASPRLFGKAWQGQRRSEEFHLSTTIKLIAYMKLDALLLNAGARPHLILVGYPRGANR
jgi:hypothetical protein